MDLKSALWNTTLPLPPLPKLGDVRRCGMGVIVPELDGDVMVLERH